MILDGVQMVWGKGFDGWPVLPLHDRGAGSGRGVPCHSPVWWSRHAAPSRSAGAHVGPPRAGAAAHLYGPDLPKRRLCVSDILLTPAMMELPGACGFGILRVLHSEGRGLMEKEEGPPDEINQARVPSCHLCDLASVGDRTPVRCRVTEGTHVPVFLHNVSFKLLH